MKASKAAAAREEDKLLSKLRDSKHRHDVFHRRAKQEGFVARSVFKLEEIDSRHHLLRAGDRVLDLGCRPGSWLQYAGRDRRPRRARWSGSTASRSTRRSRARASSSATCSR